MIIIIQYQGYLRHEACEKTGLDNVKTQVLLLISIQLKFGLKLTNVNGENSNEKLRYICSVHFLRTSNLVILIIMLGRGADGRTN